MTNFRWVIRAAAWRFDAWRRRWRRPVALGQRGEAYAARYLKRLGYSIVARQARDRWGELDLVAVDGRTVVFVEVKTRRRGDPIEAVDADKERRIIRAATSFLKRHDLLEYRCRYDILGLVWPEDARRPSVTHVRHAFEAGEND